MRLLFITSRSDFGGGPRHVDQLIDRLSPNIDIFVAYPPKGEPYGIKWDSHKRIKKTFALPHRKISVKSLLELKKFIVDNNIDIIHSHGNGAGVYSRLLKFLGVKAKVIHTFHGVTNNYTSLSKKIIYAISGRFFRHFTDYFICVSKGEFAIAKQNKYLTPSRSKVVYNGIEDFSGTKENNSTFDIVTLSRFDYQKNMDRALEIARLLKNEDIQFTWVGDGPDFSRLKETAKNEHLNVKFIGFSKEPFNYLKAASVYLSTARFEGLPYALIEAASVGLPIIATNVVGNNETLENGKTGYLFNTNEEAIKYIHFLKNNSSLYGDMVKKSKEFFKKNFSLKNMIEELENIYHTIQNDCQKHLQ